MAVDTVDDNDETSQAVVLHEVSTQLNIFQLSSFISFAILINFHTYLLSMSDMFLFDSDIHYFK